MSNTDTLRAEAEYLAACLRDMSTRAETRSFTPEEDAEFLAGRALYDEKVQILERHAEIARLAAIPENVENGDGALNAPAVIKRTQVADLYTTDGFNRGDEGALKSRALEVIERCHVEGGLDRHKESAERTVRGLSAATAERVILTSAPAYRSAFVKLAGGMSEAMLSGDERVALQRAVSLGGTGLYAVPSVLDTTIIDTGAHSENPFRRISSIKQTDGYAWNGISSAGVTASWDGELSEVSDDAPTLAQLTIPVFKGAAFVPFSIEAGQDWQNIEGDVASMITVAKDDLEGLAFVSGNGTTAPQGVCTGLDGTASEIAPTTAETFARADLVKLTSALQARFRRRAVFVGNQVWFDAIRAFETTVNVGSLISDMPVDYSADLKLAGYPAYESSDMDAVLPNAAATADNFGLVFGDFQRGYYIVDRVGLNVELVPHLFHVTTNRPSGGRGFYAHWRTGAEVVNIAALAMLSIPTTA